MDIFFNWNNHCITLETLFDDRFDDLFDTLLPKQADMHFDSFSSRKKFIVRRYRTS